MLYLFEREKYEDFNDFEREKHEDFNGIISLLIGKIFGFVFACFLSKNGLNKFFMLFHLSIASTYACVGSRFMPTSYFQSNFFYGATTFPTHTPHLAHF